MQTTKTTKEQPTCRGVFPSRSASISVVPSPFILCPQARRTLVLSPTKLTTALRTEADNPHASIDNTLSLPPTSLLCAIRDTTHGHLIPLHTPHSTSTHTPSPPSCLRCRLVSPSHGTAVARNAICSRFPSSPSDQKPPPTPSSSAVLRFFVTSLSSTAWPYCRLVELGIACAALLLAEDAPAIHKQLTPWRLWYLTRLLSPSI